VDGACHLQILDEVSELLRKLFASRDAENVEYKLYSLTTRKNFRFAALCVFKIALDVREKSV
jgi:hypothetical protein